MITKISGVFFSFLGLLFFLFLTILFFDNQNMRGLRNYENVVINVGTDLGHSKSEMFYVELEGFPQKMGVFRTFKNYDDLLNEIKKGDSLKVFYIANSKKTTNVDLIQIEKRGEIIFDKSEYQTKYRVMMVISILASVYMIYFIFSIVKYGEVENIIPQIF